MNISQINTAIINGVFSNDELTSITDAVKYARSRIQKNTIRSLRVGDSVNWDSVKTGMNTTGTVIKIAQKYVTVQTVRGLWRVPANMLTKVGEFA